MPALAYSVSLKSIEAIFGGRKSFTPSSLFAASEPGGWYDPSDLTTLYQDAAGTTPVTAVEQPVGLVLDKSRGLVLGAELVSNGTFDTNTTGWAAQTGVSITRNTSIFTNGGLLVTANGGSNSYATQTVSGLTVGTRYVLSASVYTPSTNTSDSRATIGIQGAAFTLSGSRPQTTLNTIQTISLQFVATGTSQTIYMSVVTSDLYNWGASGSVGYFDNISVRELPGSHLSQSTAAARPVLSARVNLLTYTEQFDNAAWAKTNATVAANTSETADPLGGNTAERLSETNANGRHQVTPQTAISVISGASYTVTACFKSAGRTKVALAFIKSTSAFDGFTVFADLSAVSTSVALAGAGTCTAHSIQSLGNGWFRVSGTGTIGSDTQAFAVLQINDDLGAGSYVGDPAKGIYIWGADLRPANAGVGLPAYQRVGAATSGSSTAAGNADYDTTGFPLYLKFDGTDDFLQSSTITPGADKAQVFAGVRKLSDANYALIAETSILPNANPGFVNLYAGGVGSVGTAYSSGSRGNAAEGVTQYATTSAAAPDTSVLAATHDISGDLSTIRRNGASGTSGTGDKGTGNFGDYPLYVGARFGTTTRSLFLNGHLYSLALRFSSTNLDAATISQMEQWVASKTGVSI